MLTFIIQIPHGGTDIRSRTQDRLLRLLKQKVLEHKWEDAALLMQGLSGQAIEPRYVPGKFIWEVGNEILYNHPCLRYEPNLVKDHKTAAQNMSAQDVCKARILYEYGLWMLRIGDISEAREVFRSFHTKGVKHTFATNYRIHKEMMAMWLPIFEAYLGLIDWISWKQMKDTDQLHDDDTDASPRMVMAEQAIFHFETAFQSKGNWDLFMVKYLEIMEQIPRISDAEETLRSYTLNNPKNPNAYKYWYEFLLRHPNTADNSNSRIQTLSRLKEIAPSEYYMLDLHNLRLDSAFSVIETNYDQFVSMAGMAAGVCMDMLDFDRWKQDERVWTEIASNLKRVKKAMKTEDFKEMVEDIWITSMRNSWWPQYHFSTVEAANAVKISLSFAGAKMRIARIFLGSKCAFCCSMTEHTEASQSR